jgi:hypothetical protein
VYGDVDRADVAGWSGSQPAEFYRSLLGGTVNQQDQRWALDNDWATLHSPSGLVLAFHAM